MLGAMKSWLYDESPTEGLKFEAPLAELKASIAESGSKVFQDMIKDFLVSNMHRTTVELAPSKTMEAEIVKVSSYEFRKSVTPNLAMPFFSHSVFVFGCNKIGGGRSTCGYQGDAFRRRAH